MVAQFADDPLAYKGVFPHSTLAAYLRGLNQLEQVPAGKLDLPTLDLHGSDDPIIPHSGSVETLARLVSRDFEVRIFPHARHSIFNELNRDEVFAVLSAFLVRATSTATHGLPSEDA